MHTNTPAFDDWKQVEDALNIPIELPIQAAREAFGEVVINSPDGWAEIREVPEARKYAVIFFTSEKAGTKAYFAHARILAKFNELTDGHRQAAAWYDGGESSEYEIISTYPLVRPA